MSDVTQYDRACRTPACLQPAPPHRAGTPPTPSPPRSAPVGPLWCLPPVGPGPAGG
ncbi:sigma-70 family RNA polymerase sigma factor, partial [Pseudomonas aeruginosa]